MLLDKRVVKMPLPCGPSGHRQDIDVERIRGNSRLGKEQTVLDRALPGIVVMSRMLVIDGVVILAIFHHHTNLRPMMMMGEEGHHEHEAGGQGPEDVSYGVSCHFC